MQSGAQRTPAVQAVAVEEMLEAAPAAAANIAPSAPQNVDGICMSGLNGRTAGGTDGLDTVRG